MRHVHCGVCHTIIPVNEGDNYATCQRHGTWMLHGEEWDICTLNHGEKAGSPQLKILQEDRDDKKVWTMRCIFPERDENDEDYIVHLLHPDVYAAFNKTADQMCRLLQLLGAKVTPFGIQFSSVESAEIVKMQLELYL